MRAVRLHEPGGIEGLTLDEIDVPEPGPGDVLVRVHAAAITRDELDWPTDRLPATPSAEVSGVVAKGAGGFEQGDEVFALTGFDRDGAAAEYTLVRAEYLARKPGNLSHVEAAALPMPGLTAWQALFDKGSLQAGERVLVIGASGGVGHVGVQLARWKGAELVEDGPADLIFDTSGGEKLRRAPAQLAAGGRLVSVAEEPPEGSGIYFIVEPNGAQLAEIARLAEEGEVKPEIDSTFPVDQAREAFERVGRRGKHGKVVLTCD
jgi:NADPH:quinone reductase-like Zn-dependent oxidoreductase